MSVIIIELFVKGILALVIFGLASLLIGVTVGTYRFIMRGPWGAELDLLEYQAWCKRAEENAVYGVVIDEEIVMQFGSGKEK